MEDRKEQEIKLGEGSKKGRMGGRKYGRKKGMKEEIWYCTKK